MTTHYLTTGRDESYACGADAVGRRNTRTDTDPLKTDCAECRRTRPWVGAMLAPQKGKYHRPRDEYLHALTFDATEQITFEAGVNMWKLHLDDEPEPIRGHWLVYETDNGLVICTPFGTSAAQGKALDRYWDDLEAGREACLEKSVNGTCIHSDHTN